MASRREAMGLLLCCDYFAFVLSAHNAIEFEAATMHVQYEAAARAFL